MPLGEHLTAQLTTHLPVLSALTDPGLRELASPATPGDLKAARAQMGFSLAWHIVLACLGVGMPLLTLAAEWLGLRTGDASYRLLARRWARAMGVLFAVGAVSGTILSFEMGLLWPGLMGRYGQVIGLPFAMEGIAFFIEAIFLGIYLYAWDRLSPRTHLLTGVPIVIAGIASAFFVVCANAWMNQPRGFTVRDGEVVDVDPLAAMLNPASPPQTVHMILAALMVAGFVTAGVYAVALLRGRDDRYHRAGFFIPFVFASALTPCQLVAGDWAARFLADFQPAKLAAIEGVYTTGGHVPLTLGGIAQDGRLRYGLEIPDGLSLLVGSRPGTVIKGLDQVPVPEHPPVTVVHLAFDAMVGLGVFLLLLGLWLLIAWWRTRRKGDGRVLARRGSRLFLALSAVSGVAAVVALECGWTVTEEGRQPWVVWGLLNVRDAVNPAPGLMAGLWLVLVVYAVMTVATVYVLRRLARGKPVPVAPQEDDVTSYPVV
ncbi:cytochrome ubiquinol oxidase subunit I [Streptomyces sp. MST-110588]|uniref:cytochrome ubiquinol oxidase subunit I n=1 Tax=Streptomyces sp. MST-110588 TaxID=2833628 RepID=UPI001F5CF144|nr:cytochrome ubiquinol oxidase subunit I [Streptomyces sp. MST-110588]UNO43487.1 cytochrome ubiquinol oxidase subunit I [Streptomyces sp. MST-110588]